jgi:septum site-determining protein MinC
MPTPNPPLATPPPAGAPGVVRGGEVAEVFATETMAELCVRQGRATEAVAIYRRLLGGPHADARHPRWLARLKDLEATARAAAVAEVRATPAGGLRDADLRTMRAVETLAAQLAEVEPEVEPELEPAPGGRAADDSTARSIARPSHRLPLLIHEPVRSGQIVYAEGTDLIVLAAVNPGAQLLADGNIHVYGLLRGRAVAGAKGASLARIFCLRLDAEMVGIDAAYLMADDLPRAALGKPAQIRLDAGRIVVLPL